MFFYRPAVVSDPEPTGLKGSSNPYICRDRTGALVPGLLLQPAK